jgi:hypothetical protein
MAVIPSEWGITKYMLVASVLLASFTGFSLPSYKPSEKMDEDS